LCVLTYARKHQPRMILVECTTEFQSWGPARLDRPTVGDGTTYRWWLNELKLLNYDRKIMYLNSMFFGVGQSRDRYYAVFWDRSIPAPDLEHRPVSWCASCDEQVEAVWTWRTGVPPTGTVRYGTQYNYRCPRCRTEVVPPMTPSLGALDLTNLGTRIGDRDVPLAATTMARAERCRVRFPDFPAILMPAKAMRGVERHLRQPMSTQTSQQETALLSAGLSTDLFTSSTALTGHVIAAHRHNGDGQHITRPMDTVTSTHEKAAVFAAIDNFQGVARGLDQPLPTQPGSETLALIAAGVMPFRKHTTPTIHGEAMPTVTADQAPGLLTAAGQVAVGSDVAAQWRAMLGQLAVEDLYFRMLLHYEVGRGCGFDTSFPGRPGTFKVWGSARNQIDGYGNAVSPQVGKWIGLRLRDRLHGTPQGIKIPAPRVPVG
jgi:DNA (cytosine-5)-methyltransferase 1